MKHPKFKWFIPDEKLIDFHNGKVDEIKEAQDSIIGLRMLYPKYKRKANWFLDKPYPNQHLSKMDFVMDL